MEAKLVPVKDLLNKNSRSRYLVPVYQRGYVWGQTEQWEPLWEDIEHATLKRLTPGEKAMPHFIGAAVLAQQTKARGKNSVSTFGIVDGQQRLITIQLILAALHKCADEFGVQSVARKIPEYIFNDMPKSREAKVVPNARRNGEDRNLFNNIMSMSMDELSGEYYEYFRRHYPPTIKHYTRHGTKIYDKHAVVPELFGAFGFFYEQIRNFTDGEGKNFSKSKCFHAIMDAVLINLTVVKISLDKKDDAQVIFETVNGRGQPLLQTDLIKNDIFRRAGGEKAEELFNTYWSYFEEPFWESEIIIRRQKKITLDDYFQCFLESKRGKAVDIAHLFSAYKKYIGEGHYKKDVKRELADLKKYAEIYKEVTDANQETGLGRIAQEINILKAKTIYPLILSLWGDDKKSEASKIKCLKYLISFIVRRSVCGYTEKEYNKYFLQIISEINKMRGVWSEKNLVSVMKVYNTPTRLFPNDARFNAALVKNMDHSRGNSKYMLAKVEANKNPSQHWRGLYHAGNQVEHILPQTWEEHWKFQDGYQPSEEELMDARERHVDDFGPNSQYGRINYRDRMLDAFGNLTILTWEQNKDASNLPFEDKIGIYSNDQLGLEITKEITEYSEWTEDQIIDRGEKLFEVAKKIWPALPE